MSLMSGWGSVSVLTTHALLQACTHTIVARGEMASHTSTWRKLLGVNFAPSREKQQLCKPIAANRMQRTLHGNTMLHVLGCINDANLPHIKSSNHPFEQVMSVEIFREGAVRSNVFILFCICPSAQQKGITL